MTAIPLYGRGGVVVGHALVDDADESRVSDYRWNIGSGGYARHGTAPGLVLMHRLILGLGPGREVMCDHINRDRLDNRRQNLRVVTGAQNAQNRSNSRGSKSRFRGVEWDEWKGRWGVRPRLGGTRYHVGWFVSEMDAAFAADAWRRENMPFAEPDPALADYETEREAA